MSSGGSLIDGILGVRAVRRKETLLSGVLMALTRLETAGIDAWLIGSLASDTATAFSDADFLIAGPVETVHRAFDIIDAEMGGYPFDIVQRDRLDHPARVIVMNGALDASRLRDRIA
jgi:predicted nucleotidyltransferase